MADTTKLARALIEFGADNSEFQAVIKDTAQKLSGLTKNFKETGTELDNVAKGMGEAGKQASASGQLIAGMSQSGRQELARLTQSTEQPVSGFKKILDAIGPVQAAFAGVFTTTAVIGFAREVGDFAGHMVDLSDETQISISRLQAWNYLLTGAGLTIDDFTTAVTQLQKRLGDGDEGATKAVTRLGLKVTDLVNMKPDDAFIAIAEAVAKVTNQGERTATMFDLFGRTGSRALRLVSEDLGKQVTEIEHSGAVIDEDLIRKADAFDDAWHQAWIHFRADAVDAVGFVQRAVTLGPDKNLQPPSVQAPAAFGAVNGPTLPVASKDDIKALDEQTKKVKENVKAWEEHQQRLEQLAKEISGAQASAELKDLQTAFLSLTPAQRANAAVIKDITDKYEALIAKVGAGVVPALDALDLNQGKVELRAKAMQAALIGVTPAVVDLDTAVDSLQTRLLVGTDLTEGMSGSMLNSLIPTVDKSASHMKLRAKDTTTTWTEIDKLSQSLSQLSTIAGQSFGAIAQSVATMTGALSTAHQSFTTFQSGMTEFAKGGLKNVIGGVAGIVSGIGGVVSAAIAGFQAIKALGSAIAGLFASEETKKVNKPRDQFVQQFGSFGALQGKLTDALIALGEEDAGNKADRLLVTMNDADTEAKWKSAESAIADVFSRAGQPIQQFATGGIAMRPTLGIFGEAGPEAILPLDRLSTLIPAGGRADFDQLHGEVVALRADINRSNRDLPRAMGLAFKTALVLA